MICINDTHHVEKLAPTYRVRKEAMDAAVATIGPHARHGFEYTTTKCDGRWLWKPTDEVPAPTAAEIKANGGKRSLIAMAAAIDGGHNNGTAMATLDGNTIAPACNGLDVKPQHDGSGDDLAIPGFLRREATKEEMDKVHKKLANTVGPDRPIKNPPDAKAAEKRAEKRKAAEAKFEGTPEYAKAKAKLKAPAKPVRDKPGAFAKRIAKAKGEGSSPPSSDSPKTAKRTSKAPTKTAEPRKPSPMVAKILQAAKRKNGASREELNELTNWKGAPWKWLFQNTKGNGYCDRFKLKFEVLEGAKGETRYKVTE